MNEKEILEQIGNSKTEKFGPRHIDFYISYHTESINSLMVMNRELEDEKNDFIRIKHRFMDDNELARTTETAIAITKDNISNNKKMIEIHREQLRKFETCKKSYIEDFYRGMYYNKDTGEIIDVNLTEDMFDNVYNPGNVSFGNIKKEFNGTQYTPERQRIGKYSGYSSKFKGGYEKD